MNWKWRSPIDYLYWVTELKWNKMCALWTYSKFNHRPLFLHYLSQVYSVIFHYPRKIIFKNTKIISTCAIRIFWNKQKNYISSVQFSSVAQSCPSLCDPMNHSTPGLPVHHQLPEFTQTHVHRVNDAIQRSHPLSSPSPPAPNPSQHQSLFQWVNSSHEVAKILEFQL